MTYPTEITTTRVHHGRRPPPEPFTLWGASLGQNGGALVGARHNEHAVPHVIELQTFPPSLQAMSAAIEAILADDPRAQVQVDGGLHGHDLWNHLEKRNLRGMLTLFEPGRPEMRRTELAGSLRSAWEDHGFTLKVTLRLSPTLRKAIADSTRDDAGDRPEIAALSLAIKNHRRVPRIG